MKVIITPSETNTEEPRFDSLRSAIEWAKRKGLTELHLTRIILKEGEKEK